MYSSTHLTANVSPPRPPSIPLWATEAGQARKQAMVSVLALLGIVTGANQHAQEGWTDAP